MHLNKAKIGKSREIKLNELYVGNIISIATFNKRFHEKLIFLFVLQLNIHIEL